jgi:hypothetical protein
MAFPLSNSQIADILPHVRYEIEQAFIVPAHDQNNWRIRESVFLAILVHARLLLDFFEHTRREHDNVLCSDFGFQPAPVPIPKDARLRLNKDIAHLTYSRLRHTPATKQWPMLDILRPLRDRVAAFVTHVVNNPSLTSAADEIERWKVLQTAFTKGS